MTAPCQQRRVLEAIGARERARVAAVSLDALTDASGLDRPAAGRAARVMIGKGLVRRASFGNYLLTDAGRRALEVENCVANPAAPAARKPRAPGDPLPYQRMWQAMRMARRFTQGDIAMVIDVGPKAPSDRTLRGYIAGLLDVGILAMVGRRPGSLPNSPGFKVYLLLRDVGPEAPVVRKDRVIEPNAGAELAR